MWSSGAPRWVGALRLPGPSRRDDLGVIRAASDLISKPNHRKLLPSTITFYIAPHILSWLQADR